MAYRKPVEGRYYPFLYNVSMTVGSRKALWEYIEYSEKKVGIGRDQTTTMVLEEGLEYTSSEEPNQRGDVMLVQYLLKRVYQQGHKCNPPLSQSGGAALKIDGLYGPATARAIQQFQLEMRRNGTNIATDGCVDPERGESSSSSISKTGYTISHLNKYFWVLYPGLAADITIDTECPPELKRALGDGSV